MSYAATVKTPVAVFGISVEEGRVCGVKRLRSARSSPTAEDAMAREAVQQMEHYFHDGGFRFDLPLQMDGTEFQRSVWKELQKIKPGRVKTYGEIARILKSSPRAVGNACRANPIPVIVPCHRVVSAQGIGGYAGAVDGKLLDQKRWLLAHEGVRL